MADLYTRLTELELAAQHAEYVRVPSELAAQIAARVRQLTERLDAAEAASHEDQALADQLEEALLADDVHAAMSHLLGEYRQTLLVIRDRQACFRAALGKASCRRTWPDRPHKWCVSCIATEMLSPARAPMPTTPA